MKIIKPGKLPGDRPMRGTCRVCGCVVICTQAEAAYQHDPRPGESCHTVACPTNGCGATIVVAEGAMPRR